MSDNVAPEVQALIDAAVEKAVSEYKGLKEKNTELLGKLKEKQTYADQLAEAKEKAELEALEKAGNIDAVKKQIEDKFLKQIAEKDTAVNDYKAKLQKLVIDDGLTGALAKAGIAPQYMDAAKALLKNSAQFAIGDDLTAKVGEEPLADFVVKWATSEAGKPFVAAPLNAGSGAKGANGVGKATAKTITRGDFDALSQADRAAHIKSGGQVTD